MAVSACWRFDWLECRRAACDGIGKSILRQGVEKSAACLIEHMLQRAIGCDDAVIVGHIEALGDVEVWLSLAGHITQIDLGRRARQGHAAIAATRGGNETLAGEVVDDFDQVVARNTMKFGNLGHSGQAGRLLCQKNQNSIRIVGVLGELHGSVNLNG